MEAPRIGTLALLLLSASLISSSCKKADSSAENPTPPIKKGRWVAQYRSPESKQYVGYLGLFSYNSISVVSPDVAFVAADVPDPKDKNKRAAVILRTSDGGETWVELSLPKDSKLDRLDSIHFVNNDVGWVVGSEPPGIGFYLHTTDGGTTWSQTKLGFKQTPTCLFFTDSQRGWMGGVTGEDEDEEGGPSDILATTDGGATWFSQRRVPISIVDLFFLDGQVGWATGYRGAIYRTTDGGATWDSQRSGLEPANAGLPAGASTPDSFTIMGIHFVDSQRGWAAAMGDAIGGLVIGTTDGGATWQQLLIARDQRLRDVLFLSSTEGWATLSASEFVYHTTDGGRRWEAEPVSFDEHPTLYRLAAAGNSKMWAVGAGGIFARLMQTESQ